MRDAAWCGKDGHKLPHINPEAAYNERQTSRQRLARVPGTCSSFPPDSPPDDADWTIRGLPGSVAMAAVPPFSGLVSELETYRGRDRVIRTICYGCQLAGGILVARRQPGEPSLGQGLLAVSAQLSHCRTVLRLFDDLAMLSYSCQYGLGNKEKDTAMRWLSIFNNVADQLYYPCEHVAWAADAEIIHANSSRWWTLSTTLWGFSLLLGIARSLRILLLLRRKQHTESRDFYQKTRAEMHIQALTIISNLADLANAIHWLPPGILWAGKFSPWFVGLMGSISSFIGIYQNYAGASCGTV
ncbi:peroxisomal membrane protein 11C [Notechis scutatus]|uniref:Peroxisomal membrane protein 11C n=1 Tax=Notechis scutatus TaxID=8663 RepID=A0A6J1U6X0_9SAUR|nr:peroxisomal membrane protein 11C [Notechis scutatus]